MQRKKTQGVRLRSIILASAGALALSSAPGMAQSDPHAHAPRPASGSVPLGTITVVDTRSWWTNFVTASNEAPDSDLVAGRMSSNDAARLFERIPGVSLQSAGGVSALPVVEGFASDRVKTLVNGMSITSSCGNFMNPPLSYIDSGAVQSAKVYAGVTPVSMGGDSIGGTISASSAAPVFAPAGKTIIAGGRISSFFRSNGNGIGGNLYTYLATNDFSISYNGATVVQKNYRDGNGNGVGATLYKATNHLVRAAGRSENHRLGIDVGWQEIPYQGFVNQFMDMTDNRSVYVNANYAGDYNWGTFEARFFRHDVRHSMDKLEDKLRVSGRMPMETEGSDTGYKVQANITSLGGHILRLGNEYHRYRLDDWWPPVSGSMMMSPETYLNINDGRRDRFALFGEIETSWTPQWQTMFGVRYEHVITDTGTVRNYTGLTAEAAAFNARDRRREDHNLDLTGMLRYEPVSTHALELGLARKTRSPNLYERYAWSAGAMAASMINWFGDLNGYVGNIDLKPEVAHTARASLEWHDAGRRDWHVKLTGHYSRVDDYINAERIGLIGSATARRALLRFINHDAELYGANLEAAKYLGHAGGDWKIRSVVSYLAGKDLEADISLYNIMPLNALVALDHTLGNWSSTLEVLAVADKDRVDTQRFEQNTEAYALVNLRTRYTYGKARLDLGIDNLFDSDYQPSLGGLSAIVFTQTGNRNAARVQGPGRSFNAGLTVEF